MRGWRRGHLFLHIHDCTGSIKKGYFACYVARCSEWTSCNNYLPESLILERIPQ
jgi:hypothetical protein